MHRITFVATSRISASAEAVFDWHEAPGAFERLTPSGERVRVVRTRAGFVTAPRCRYAWARSPFALRWDLEHRDYQRGRSFTDLQLAGPFRYWKHVHRMVPTGSARPRSSKTRSSTNCRSVRSDGWSAGSSCREN